MSLGKSIDRRMSKLIYILLISNLFLIPFFLFLPRELTKLFLIFDFLLCIIFLVVILNPNKTIQIVKVFLVSCVLYFILAIFFRSLRSSFPDFGKDSSIVGFAQYFNYPIYFDIFLFAVILIIPFASYFLIRRFK